MNSRNVRPFDPARRDLLRAAVAGTLLSCAPLLTAEAAPSMPTLRFSANRTRDGVVGPWGEIRVLNSGGIVLPTMVVTNGGFGVMNFAVQRPYVQLGGGDNRIVFSGQGVQLRSGDPLKPWSADAVRAIHAAIARDRNKLRGLLELRSALHTTFTVAAAWAKGVGERRFASTLAKGSGGLGARSMQGGCTTTTISETVVRTVTEYVNVIKTAQQQYDECYARNVRSGTCSSLGPMAGTCASGYCLAMGFVDLVVGFYEVTRTFAEEVVRTLVVCAAPIRGGWPNPVTLIENLPVRAALPRAAQAYSEQDKSGALLLLEKMRDIYLGPFARCLLKGEWSIAQLDTRIEFGDGTIGIPYGIKVCVSSACASSMALMNLPEEYARSYESLLGAMAGLDDGMMDLLTAAGLASSPLVLASLAAAAAVAVGLTVAVKACMFLMLAFILLALYYGTVISGQLAFHELATHNFSDGVVCIEHPSFALALIRMLTLGFAPTELIPPIVTG